jgi:hypothetical protein
MFLIFLILFVTQEKGTRKKIDSDSFHTSFYLRTKREVCPLLKLRIRASYQSNLFGLKFTLKKPTKIFLPQSLFTKIIYHYSSLHSTLIGLVLSDISALLIHSHRLELVLFSMFDRLHTIFFRQFFKGCNVSHFVFCKREKYTLFNFKWKMLKFSLTVLLNLKLQTFLIRLIFDARFFIFIFDLFFQSMDCNLNWPFLILF